MKKIISLLLIVLFATTAYSVTASADDAFPTGRVTATGDEPNGDGQTPEEANQSGVTVPGAGASQVKVCKNCQQAGNVLLSSSTRRAAPGIIQQFDSGTSAGAKKAGGTSNEPVNTGK
ncbi:hypothetical protein CIK05_00615 [Bdellovibrio sp. qaytius]|nr:hypothetical protein CIK05_00615 [Bdellovibrio sp. qaytius]